MKLDIRRVLPGTAEAPPTGQTPDTRPSNLPADPSAILAKQGQAPTRRRPKILLAVIVVALSAELFGPAAWKPSLIAGDAAARFYFSIMSADNIKQTELIEQQMVAQRLAEREMEYDAWIGRCNVVMMFDYDTGAACHVAAEAFYADAIEGARRELERLTAGDLP